MVEISKLNNWTNNFRDEVRFVNAEFETEFSELKFDFSKKAEGDINFNGVEIATSNSIAKIDFNSDDNKNLSFRELNNQVL